MAGVQAGGADVRSDPAEPGPLTRPARAELLGQELVGLSQGQGEPGGGAPQVCRQRGESRPMTCSLFNSSLFSSKGLTGLVVLCK
jgi:hypothetical protein